MECQILGEEIVPIFQFHNLVLHDPRIEDSIRAGIREQHYTAEYAVSRVLRHYIKRVRSLRDSYMRERYVDIYDVERRLLRRLLGARREEIHSLTREVVIIARDLTPSQLAGFDRSTVVGFATDAGGKTSHTAIVARTMGIPAVVGLETITAEVSGGDKVIIDGTEGKIFINPDPETMDRYTRKEVEFRRNERDLGCSIRDLPSETLDGHPIELLVNIEMPGDIDTALTNGAMGVGLYRTEFIYVDHPSPHEDDHVEAYQAAGGAESRA